MYNRQLGGVPEGEESLMMEQNCMEEAFDAAAPEIDELEARQVKELIRWILQYEPAERPSAKEILAHPWFCALDV